MKLLSVSVRNYRLHRDLTIEFDPARTLIGGANETGKSTLIEAVHRALFLKSTVTGEGQRSMVSNFSLGYPEVEIRFMAKGAVYQVTKHFSGGNGTVKLVQEGGNTWRGEEAEARLADLLGVEEPGGGRGILGRVDRQWSHLWVWQGKSGDDPSEHTASQQSHLLQQLQRTGGAVAMQSELDGRMASLFAQRREQIFTRTGRPRSNSDPDRANKEVEQAEAERARAAERLERLQQAVREFDEASVTIERATSDLERLRKERESVGEKISRVEELRQDEKEHESAVERAVERQTALEDVEGKIDGFRESIYTLKESLEPERKEEEHLESRLDDRRRRKREAEQEYEAALEETREVRLRRDLASAWVSQFEKEARYLELDARLERVRELKEEIESLREQMAQLPAIDREGFEALQHQKNELDRASAALDAMAAEVEVVEADRPVWVGDSELPVGGRCTVVEPTELKIDDSLRLRIHPGGGDSLADARKNVSALRESIQRSLDEYGLESIGRASEVVLVRADLHSKEGKAQSALGELDVEDPAEELSGAKNQLVAAEADVQRRSDLVTDAETPQTVEDARAWLEREEASLKTAEGKEARLKGARDELQEEEEKLQNELNDLRATIQEEKQKLTEIEAQLRFLIDNSGDDETRSEALEEARKVRKEAEATLAKTREALEVLQPDLLEADRERLQRAWNEKDRQRRDAENYRAGNQAILRLDGTDDPNAVLARAEARLESATEHREAVDLKARAIALIDDLFQKAQHTLADRFSQPLAQRITTYLQCLFGPDARAVVRLEDNTLGIQLVRSARDGAMSFDALSGGAREQVAAAVRLAIAELLAADHDGSLPIVFDDAFAYSDPDRVNMLQRMLDLGASRGLQIVVLTCNPSDYAALGASQIILKAELPRNVPLEHTSLPPGDGLANSRMIATAGSSADPISITDQDCEELIAALSNLEGHSGNQSLRKILGWDETKYSAVKDRLIAQNRILPGRGRGGSVSLTSQ